VSNEGFSIRPSQKKLEQPRRVRHGIKFRRKQGLEALPWHAAGFVAAVEEGIRPDAKVLGMEYALAGQVANYAVSPGVVEASVQGRVAKPYQVRITVKPLSREEWDAVISRMASEAVYAARLLTGEVPESIEECFETARPFEAGMNLCSYGSRAEHHASWRWSIHEARRQLWVICTHGAGADEDRVAVGAQFVHASPCRNSGEPAFARRWRRDTTVDSRGHLDHHVRATRDAVVDVCAELVCDGRVLYTDDDVDSCCTQSCDARASHVVVRVLNTDDDS